MTPPSKWRDPHDLERREGRFELNNTVEDIAAGLLAASIWLLTGDTAIGIEVCPDSGVRARGCRILARILKAARAGRR